MEANIKITGDIESLKKCREALKKTTDNLVKKYPVVLEKRKFKLYKLNQRSLKNFKRCKR
ncbi:hypothetical protein ES707_14265 [subsurface metagenome]